MGTLEQREKKRLRNERYRLKLKLECFQAYGGAQCSEPWCHATDVDELELHHPEGGGNKDRAEIMGEGLRSPGGWKFYLELRKAGFPNKDKYRVVCRGCHDTMHGRAPGVERQHCPPGMDTTRDDRFYQ